MGLVGCEVFISSFWNCSVGTDEFVISGPRLISDSSHGGKAFEGGEMSSAFSGLRTIAVVLPNPLKFSLVSSTKLVNRQ